MQETHKVPTHMNIPDKVVFGLTARQLLILFIGCSAGYDLWLQLHLLGHYAVVGTIVRAGIALLPTAVALALALLSVAGRPLEVWVLVLFRYRQHPRTYVWRSIRILHQWESADAGDRAKASIDEGDDEGLERER